MTLLRREFLAVGTAAMLPATPTPSFEYRGYLGWITDLSTQPDPHAAWPSTRLDGSLQNDYLETFQVMKELGLQNLCVWGLYVSRAWPVDLDIAVPAQRGRGVDRLISAAHAKGIRVLSGLGVYSWGFDQILKANPHLMKGNSQAMCGSEEESWQWMRKVIDFVFTRFPIDGVSMQSADQGRCRCDQCGRYGDTEYHVRLNLRCAAYIKSRYPGKTIGVSGWGMRFDDPQAFPHVAELGRHIDYIIDVRDSSRQSDPALRKKLIDAVPCAFGTLGGPQVEPPQHWDRARWFLPTIRSAGEHLRELYRDGGRACEWFYHILANPGCEISTWVAGRTLADPLTPWQKHLSSSIERIYGVSKSQTRDALAEGFLAAEDAYTRYLPPRFCGTISLEPLVSSEPGPPVYLSKRLNAEQRRAYASAVESVRGRFEKLVPDVPERGPGRSPRQRLRFIVQSCHNVQKDLAVIAANA